MSIRNLLFDQKLNVNSITCFNNWKLKEILPLIPHNLKDSNELKKSWLYEILNQMKTKQNRIIAYIPSMDNYKYFVLTCKGYREVSKIEFNSSYGSNDITEINTRIELKQNAIDFDNNLQNMYALINGFKESGLFTYDIYCTAYDLLIEVSNQLELDNYSNYIDTLVENLSK
jgi:hypothetical protein